ncbi:MAG: heparinase II/III family protein, partial [Bacteroidota bacterium]
PTFFIPALGIVIANKPVLKLFKMHLITRFLSFLGLLFILQVITGQETSSLHKLQNPVNTAYLKKKLSKRGPNLVLNPRLERQLKQKIRTDPVVRNLYEGIRSNAQAILKKPFLKRELQGKRLLAVSREMLYRVNILALVYRMERDSKILDRLNHELQAVCAFSDWNPKHFLDVGEMALAVALAIDWAGEDLPENTVEQAKKALVNKGIKPSYKDIGTWWIGGDNNWNQVCHGGMVAASIVTADREPELAAKTIRRALDSIPKGLVAYAPDGVYPEGSTYWKYGTSFSVLTIAMLESAFGTDFGLSDSPGFMESAHFRLLSNAPSGYYYNFSDCGDKRRETGDMTLAWFAQKTGNAAFFEKERFLRPVEDMGKMDRNAGAALVWISQFKEKERQVPPRAWIGQGENPVALFTSDDNDPYKYYLGAKGGKGMNNHGNMDAGSFVFELDGVRWSVDPGNQNYYQLEKTGFTLWKNCQDCERWTLLTKNNFGHSTLTVDGALHKVDGQAIISNFEKGKHPEVTFDLSAAFEGQLKQAFRRFAKDGDRSLLIEDRIQVLDSTKWVAWQLITQADVEMIKNAAVLHQEDKKLLLENLSHPEVSFSVISLDPPPLALDRRIPGLKRLELRIPAYLLKDGENQIKVQLSGF